MKVACVLITHLPMKAELGRNSSLRDRPALIITQSGGGATVLDASWQAKGVSLGMPIQAALSRCNSAAVIEADELYYQRVFDKVVEALLDKSPTVEKGELGCAYVDVHGTEGIYEGEQGITNALLEAVPDDLSPRVGLAKAKFPAYVAAIASKAGRATKVPKDVPGFLSGFPVDLLPLSWEDRARLHQDFGLHLIGQVGALPVGSMQAQYGTQGRVAWELANGIDRSPLVPSKYQEMATDFLTFPVPATSLFTILPAVEILLGRLFFHPSLKDKSMRSVSIQASVLNRPAWSKKFVFASPVDKKETALFALRNTLEAAEFPGPLEDMRISVFETAGESGIQSSIFVEVRKQNQLREVIRQLEARLRAKSPIYKVMDMEPWSRVPERRQALVEFVP